ncbi:MAG: CocE/NonD family hydrolase [Myxococcota bacterium]
MPLATFVLLAASVQQVQVPTTDATELNTYVYLPDTPGTVPTVLVRTPYGATGTNGGGVTWADSGAAYVVQDVRGSGESAGEFCLMLCDGDDGADTVEWIRGQPWSNGVVVMLGNSASAMTAVQAVANAPEGLDAFWASVPTGSLYDTAFPGGVLRNAINDWLAATVSEEAQQAWADNLALHPVADEFWASGDAIGAAEAATAVGFHTTGWYDLNASSAIDTFIAFEAAAPGQRIVIGPYGHASATSPTAEGVQFGDIVVADINGMPPAGDTAALRDLWLQHHLGLADNDAEIADIPAVQYFVFGDDDVGPQGHWRTADAWPIPAAAVPLHLHADGVLAEDCASDDGSATGYVSDPTDPTPTVGGASLNLPSGPFDQTEVEARDDVVVFTSEPMAQDEEVIGRATAELWVTTDSVDADVMVRLTDVYPDGRSILLRDAGVRLATVTGTVELLTPGEPVLAPIDLGHLATIIGEGHRLRISISSTNAPQFFINPGDGTYYGGGGTSAPVAVDVLHDRDYPSRIVLPMPLRADDSLLDCEGDGDDGGSSDGADEGGDDGADGTTGTAPGDDGDGDPTGPGAEPGTDEGDETGSDADGSAAEDDDPGGCSCRSTAPPRGLALVLLLLGLRRRSPISR